MDRRIEQIDAQLNKAFGAEVTMNWQVDVKGAVWGQCKLSDPKTIVQIALIVATFKGRLMTITPYLHGADENKKVLSIAYHFDIQGVTITCTISLANSLREVQSITPILKSADWNEREMQEMYNVQVVDHPNPNRLFLDDRLNLSDHTMVPLSEAMSGASTQTLWERVMASTKGGGKEDE